jgi:hypothetical protein
MLGDKPVQIERSDYLLLVCAEKHNVEFGVVISIMSFQRVNAIEIDRRISITSAVLSDAPMPAFIITGVHRPSASYLVGSPKNSAALADTTPNLRLAVVRELHRNVWSFE